MGSILLNNIPLNDEPPHDTFNVFTSFEVATPFDRVRLSVNQSQLPATAGMVEYMSFAVPAPGAALLMALGAVCTRRRRSPSDGQ